MRRAGLNLDEEYIHALIDRLETPVHLAATAGMFFHGIECFYI